MASVGIIFTNERDKFSPFLKFGSAVKDPNDAFAFTIVWEKIINIVMRRIYSVMCDNF